MMNGRDDLTPDGARPADGAGGRPAGAVRFVTVTKRGPMLTAAAVAVLTGVPLIAARAWMAQLQVASSEYGLTDRVVRQRLPTEWAKAGKRRAREAMAHAGTENAMAGFAYWTANGHPDCALWQDHCGLWMVPRAK